MSQSAEIADPLVPIVNLLKAGDPGQALVEFRKLKAEGGSDENKVKAYLLLINQKYPEADSLCTKLLQSGLDHEILTWRGIARAELGLWFSSLEDFDLAQEFFPQEETQKRIDQTAHRACKNLSDGMRLDGGSFQDFYERARVYVLQGDWDRGERDLLAARKIKPESIDLKPLSARRLFAIGKTKEAQADIDAYLNSQPDNLSAVILKAKIKAATGRVRSALALLRQAALTQQGDEIGHLRLASCRHEIRDFHGAVRDYTQILERNPNSAAAYFGRGQSHLEIRLFDAAIDDFEKAKSLGGTNATLLTRLGEAKLAKGLRKEASALFKTARKIEPNLVSAQIGYAQVKKMRGKPSEALSLASQCLKQNPKSAEAYFFLGSIQFDEKDFDSAVHSFSQAIELTCSQFETANGLYRRGSALLENQKLPEAINDLNEALELRPHHVGTLVWRGYAKAKLGQWADAMSDLQSAIDMNPLAAEQYKKLGDFIAKEALNYFQDAISKNKSNASAFFNRGMANLFLDNRKQAEQDFSEALKLDGQHAEAQIRLGTLQMAEGQPKKAYNQFSKAMKSKPSANALLLRADAMLRLGVIQPAFIDIRDAIRSSRDNDRLYVRRGELYATRDNLEKALDDFTLSIALNFDNYLAFRERGRLFRKRAMPKEAIRDLSLSLHFNYQQPELLVERGLLHLELRQFESALLDFESALGFGGNPNQRLENEQLMTAYIGWAKSKQNLDQGQDGLAGLTKAIHRFEQPESWAKLVKARGDIFLSMGRFERASADARIASKLYPDPKFSASCYYLRALCSYYHNDRDHALKTLQKAADLDPEEKAVETALDWFGEIADAPPSEWNHPPEKIRPKRPQTESGQTGFELDTSKLEVEPPMDLWLIKKGDQEFGPIPLKTVAEWCKEGRIDDSTKLFRTDWGKWKSVQSVRN